jgi:pimeloyl-ACP methyl ester carboxylesterase
MIDPILDRPAVLRVLFYPRRDDELALCPPGVYPLTVKVEPGIAVGGRLYPAAPGRVQALVSPGAHAPAILYFHGNGEIAADYDDIAPLYTRLGISLLVADYRGYGTSGGRPTASHLLADAVTLFDQAGGLLADHGLAPERLYVMGRSLGSAAAIEVALRRQERLAGLIIDSGFADTFALLARMGLRAQGADEARDGFGNAAKIGRIRLPTLIVHGESDTLIPASDAWELHRSSAASDKRLVLIPGAGHNNLMWVGRQAYFDAIQALVFPASSPG